VTSSPQLRKLRSKIRSPQALARYLRTERSRRGKKPQVVFTNGCFDLLHRGHVTYLEQARLQGSALVVALNTDESVKRLKGPTRPVNTLEDRLAVLAALECVDHVTWFGEDTPLEIIQLLKPDVLVKGGDYKPDQMVGAREVKSWGGKVKALKFVEGQSTTKIIERSKSAPTQTVKTASGA
jgi:D-beta-D-heptose 7-phosphate kinase/D-beta-D-heptose 1-phosphate adenosyltransferase